MTTIEAVSCAIFAMTSSGIAARSKLLAAKMEAIRLPNFALVEARSSRRRRLAVSLLDRTTPDEVPLAHRQKEYWHAARFLGRDALSNCLPSRSNHFAGKCSRHRRCW